MNEYFSMLEIAPTSEKSIIKKAYLSLMKKYHPDTYDGDKDFASKKCADINVAYNYILEKLDSSIVTAEDLAKNANHEKKDEIKKKEKSKNIKPTKVKEKKIVEKKTKVYAPKKEKEEVKPSPSENIIKSSPTPSRKEDEIKPKPPSPRPKEKIVLDVFIGILAVAFLVLIILAA